MSRLRWQLRSYIVGVIVAGAGLLALATFGPHPTATADLLVIAILLGLATVAQVWPVHLSLKVKLTVDDTPLFAAALLLGPFVSMLVRAVVKACWICVSYGPMGVRGMPAADWPKSWP